jgi:hypothetical protein
MSVSGTIEYKLAGGGYMVIVDRSEGQFYTMEGVAAAILMVLTAYLVMGATTVYTPGDTHIIDMQLEQVGNDALKMMDTKDSVGSDRSVLETIVRDWNPTGFDTTFRSYLNDSSIHFQATVYNRIDSNGTIQNHTFYEDPNYLFYPSYNGVVVSRWVFLEKHTPPKSGDPLLDSRRGIRNETVLLEVLLWRG